MIKITAILALLSVKLLASGAGTFSVTTGGGSGSGSVTSVGLLDSTNLFNISGSPVTSSGNLTLSSFANQSANTFLANNTSGSAAPSFTNISSLAGNAISFAGNSLGIFPDGQTIVLTASGKLMAITAGTGTVTSVGLSLPNIFNVSGSPVASAGTLTGTLASQSQSTAFMGPSSGSGTPSFRSIQFADIPGTLALGSSVTGVLPIANGGTNNGTALLGGRIIISGGGSLGESSQTFASLPQGTVTSAALADSTNLFNVTGSPITSSGTLTLSSYKNQSANTFLANNTSSTAAPTFQALSSLPGNGVSFGGSSLGIFPDGVTIKLNGSGQIVANNTGTVTSTALSDSTNLFNVTGSPVTSSGTLTLSSYKSQSANTFLANNTGSTAAPTFQALSSLAGTAMSFAGSSLGVQIDGSTIVLDGSGRLKATAAGGGGSGTVTSVALSDATSLFNITGSPVTSSGTLTLSSFGSGKVPIANGGTNNGAALLNGRIIVSGGGSLGESTIPTSTVLLTTGPFTGTTRTVGSSTVLDTGFNDYLVYLNLSAFGTVTLPPPTCGRVLYLKDILGVMGNGSSVNVILKPNASEKIEGVAGSRTLQTNYGSWTVTNDCTNWWLH